MKTIYHYLILLPILSISFSLTAQHGGYMNHWHFGWFASMEFTTGSPVATTGSIMICEEGSASCSDDQGNLLFYTNGGGDVGNLWPGGVWNRDHQMMPNGAITGLTGSDSSPQSSLVIPNGGSEYYLFTIGSVQTNEGLRLSIVDMALDGGLGDLTLVGDPLLISPTATLAEGLTATAHANGVDHWLIVHSRIGNDFYIFQVTPTGITGPTIQTIGNTTDSYGQIKFSVQGDKLVTGSFVYNFDNTTGVISNPVDLGDSGWGRAFSYSGRYLYVGQLGPISDIHQFDMQATDIQASKTLIGTNNSSPLGPFQLGPDHKIYMSLYTSQSLAAINSPEAGGIACDFVVDQVALGASPQLSIPNFIDSRLIAMAGVNEISNTNILERVAPNPTSDYLFLSEDININVDQLHIISISGQQLDNWLLDGHRIDVSELSSGVYIIVYNGMSARFVKK